MVETKGRVTVSVAIIAKNEAATITPTIESVKDLVDEIVVLVDNTTTDNTAELAKNAGAHIVESFTWKDNFAKARNKAIAKCTMDWVCIMDAHEVLHPNSRMVLTDLLQRVTKRGDLKDTEVFSGFIYMNPKGDKIENLVPETFLMQPRLFKNNGDHFYEGRVHNFLVSKKGNRGLKRPVPELVFIHKRTEDNDAARRKQRAQMNVELLLKDITENPDLPRSYFYLANTYYEMEKYDDALKYYELYLERSKWSNERAQALLMAGSILAEQKKYKKAREYLMIAIKEDWERPEFYMLLGDIALNQQKFYEAEHWYKSACDMKPPIKSGMFLRGPCYTHLPYAKLAMIYSTPGVEDYFKALQAGEKAIGLGYPGEDLKEKMDIWRNKLTLKPGCKNLLIYDENNKFTFIRDLSSRLVKTYNIATGAEYDYEHAQWADVIWFEWCARTILKASNLPKKEGQKWIVRLHGYEVYSPVRIQKIQWDKVDVLVFVCEHVQTHFNELYYIPDTVQQVVIPNGIDIKQWTYMDRSKSKTKNIGIVGILTEKKGPQLLGQVIQHFAKYHKDYKFLLRLDVIEKPCMSERTLNHMIKDCKNWEWIPRQESLNRFFEGVDYLLSTSTLESFSYVVGEAMCKGIKPLIHDWIGARAIWPENLIWKDIKELEKLLKTKYDSKEYRNHILSNYTLDKLEMKIKNVIESFFIGTDTCNGGGPE